MSGPFFHIFVAESYDTATVARLETIGRVTILSCCDESTLVDAVADCDALLVRSHARVTRALMRQAKRLRVIGRGGVGVENIDLEAAREFGVTVVHTPAAATQAVADLTVGLILSLLRHLAISDRWVREGRFDEARNLPLARELGSLTLGIVGFGRIGRAVARRCSLGFGTRILFNDIVHPPQVDFPATPMEKDALYRMSDVVSLHVPLTERTVGLINRRTLGVFKPGAFLINTARGGVVDGEALAEALWSGRLSSAGMDVFDPEPLPLDHPLAKAPNTLFTPHAGARTRSGQQAMSDVVEDVIRVLRGESPLYPAYPEPMTVSNRPRNR